MIDQNLKSQWNSVGNSNVKRLDRTLVIQGLVQAQDTTKVIFPNLIKKYTTIINVENGCWFAK